MYHSRQRGPRCRSKRGGWCQGRYLLSSDNRKVQGQQDWRVEGEHRVAQHRVLEEHRRACGEVHQEGHSALHRGQAEDKVMG